MLFKVKMKRNLSPHSSETAAFLQVTIIKAFLAKIHALRPGYILQRGYILRHHGVKHRVQDQMIKC